ncbi:MAG: putative ABC transport system permease protein [Bacteroidia bacterium]|jgi:putative ABC transport system permease protein
MIIQIAWKNIWRNRNRSLVVISAMVVATVAVLFMMSFMWGMSEYRIKEAIELETSHLQIHDSSFTESFEAKHIIDNPEQYAKLLTNDPRIKSFSRRVITNGIAQSSRSTTGVLIYGVNKEEEMTTSGLHKEMVEGEYMPDSRLFPAVIGKDLADKLKLELKNKMVLQMQDIYGDIVPIRVKIVGIFETNNSRYDALSVFVPQDRLSELLKLEGGINEIAILLNNPDDLNEVRTGLEVNAKNAIKTWKEISPELALAIDSFDKAMIIMVIIFFLAVALVIINIMLMAILERVRELGMLMAIGMNKLRVFFMVMFETVLLSLVGLPIGLLIGYLIIETTGKSGIDITELYGEGISEMGYNSIIYPTLPSEQYWVMAGQVMLIIFIAAIVPARRALKLNPATAIRKI